MNIINQTNPYFMQIKFKPKDVFFKLKEMKDETCKTSEVLIFRHDLVRLFNNGLLIEKIQL